MNLIVKNILGIVIVAFLFVALGQWNQPKFQEKAYDQAKELITADQAEKGEKPGRFIEGSDFSDDLLHVGIVTEGGTKYLYDVSIQNPLWVQLSVLNLVSSPKVEIAGFVKSRP
jgi:hypothetical protein